MPNSLEDSRDARGPQGAAAEREPASLVRRAIATVIDLGCAAFVGAAAHAVLRHGVYATHVDGSSVTRWTWSVTFALPAWLALSVLEALPGRAGPGKRVLGLTIEGPRQQESPSFARIALRTAIKWFPLLIAALAFLFPTPWDPRHSIERSRFLALFGSNLWIGIYMASAAMTRRRQALHDLATGTVVLSVARPLPPAARHG